MSRTILAARPSLRARLGDRATDAAYASGWRLVRMLPERAARGLFEGVARRAAARDGRGVRQLRANLRTATGGALTEGELDALTARAMRSYARYWQEAFRLPTLGAERIVTGTVATGVHHLERIRREGRGMVIAIPHSGNWDAAGVWLIHWLGGPFMTVAERLRPESLFRRFLAYRESLGMRVLPLTGGERPTSAVLREWLADHGTVCLLVDRDLGGGGVPVTLLGRAASMPGGPALLADRTGAALVPAVCRFTDTGWEFVVHPEVVPDPTLPLRARLTAAMQEVADAFSATIPERPEDWHMLGRIWADVPPDLAAGEVAGRPAGERA